MLFVSNQLADMHKVAAKLLYRLLNTLEAVRYIGSKNARPTPPSKHVIQYGYKISICTKHQSSSCQKSPADSRHAKPWAVPKTLQALVPTFQFLSTALFEKVQCRRSVLDLKLYVSTVCQKPCKACFIHYICCLVV